MKTYVFNNYCVKMTYLETFIIQICYLKGDMVWSLYKKDKNDKYK